MQYDKLITKYFISIEAIIYVTFILLDILGTTPALSDIFKYSGIIVVFAFALYWCIKRRDRNRTVVTSALLFTAVADFFLLFCSDDIRLLIPVLLSFSVTQTLYYVHLTESRRKNKRILIPCLVFVLSAVSSCIIDLLLSYDTVALILITLVFYYAITFALNTAGSVARCKKSRLRTDFIFALGLILFVLCDINVLIRHLNTFFFEAVPRTMVEASIFLSWVFYLPAQVLIALHCKTSDDPRPLGSGSKNA